MTPTAFTFSVSLPADARLIEAITQLSAHAAGYANLSDAASAEFTGDMRRALETGIASVANADMITIDFVGDAMALTATLHWTEGGAAKTRQVRQLLSA